MIIKVCNGEYKDMKTNKKYYDLTRLSKEVGFSKTVIKSILVDYNIPNVQIGTYNDGAILVDYDKFIKVFNEPNVKLRLRVLKNREKNRGKCKEWYKENEEMEKKKSKIRADKTRNTFGRTGHKRGQSGRMLRDYELTEEQLDRRNYRRQTRGNRNSENFSPCSVLIWYDGTLDDLSIKEYKRLQGIEWKRQQRAAITGKKSRNREMSEHFLFDFDLEQMLKENKYVGGGNNKIYITKWWKGEIRHWTVKDGIWRET